MNLFKYCYCSFMDHICGNIVHMHLINVLKHGIFPYVTCYIYRIMAQAWILGQGQLYFPVTANTSSRNIVRTCLIQAAMYELKHMHTL